VLFLQVILSQWDLLVLSREDRATSGYILHCPSYQLLKLFSGHMSDPLLLYDHLLWPSISQTLWAGVSRLPVVQLFLGF
jgi:hypothetical protein